MFWSEENMNEIPEVLVALTMFLATLWKFALPWLLYTASYTKSEIPRHSSNLSFVLLPCSSGVCSIHPQTQVNPQRSSSFSEVFRQRWAGQIPDPFCLTVRYAVYVLSGLHVMHYIVLDYTVCDVHSACDVIWEDTMVLYCPFLTLAQSYFSC